MVWYAVTVRVNEQKKVQSVLVLSLPNDKSYVPLFCLRICGLMPFEGKNQPLIRSKKHWVITWGLMKAHPSFDKGEKWSDMMCPLKNKCSKKVAIFEWDVFTFMLLASFASLMNNYHNWKNWSFTAVFKINIFIVQLYQLLNQSGRFHFNNALSGHLDT